MRIEQLISGVVSDHLAEALLLVGSDGSILDANPAALACYGYATNEMVGLHIQDICAPRGHGDDDATRFGVEAAEPFDAQHLRGDGTIFPAEVRQVHVDIDGETAVLVFVRDVSDLAHLAEDAERKRLLLGSMAEGVALHEIILDDAGRPCDYRYLSVNRAFEEMTGLKSADVVGRTAREVLPSLDPTWVEQCGAVAATGVAARFEDKKGGSGRHYGVVAYSPQRGQFVTVISDISESKRSEEALEKSQLLLSSSIETQADTIILSIDREYRYLHFNRAYSDVMKSMYGTDVRVGMSLLDCITSDDDRAAAKANYDRALKGESHSNVREYGDVDRAYYESFFNPVMSNGEIIGVTILARDITEGKRAEKYTEMGRDILQILNEPSELQESLTRVVDTLKARTGLDAVGIRLRDTNDFPYHANEGCPADFLLWKDVRIVCAAEGAARRDKRGRVEFECACGLFLGAGTDADGPVLTPGGSFWTNDSHLVLDVASQKGHRIHAREQCVLHGFTSIALVPIRDGRGIVGLIHLGDHRADRFSPETMELLEAVASHIGAALLRKQAEGALRDSEEKFRSVVEHTNDGIAVVQNGRVCYGNPALVELTGYSLEELDEVGGLASLSHDGQDFPIGTRRPSRKDPSTTSEMSLRRRDGSIFSAEVRVSVVTYRAAPANMVLVRNITARKEAEEHLLRYQARLQALTSELVVSREHERGRLGVELHDGLGQELAAAKMMAQILASEPLGEFASEQAEKLVALLSESIGEVRQLTSELAPIVLFELGLGSSLLWLRDRYGQLYGLRCIVRTSQETKHLRGDTAELIFRVAREALNNVVRHSGVLRATVSVGMSAGCYTVCVSDRGVGFDAALVDDPGEVGGFGLFSIREECRGVGGTVEIQSRLGQGTQVRVRLPAEAGPAAS